MSTEAPEIQPSEASRQPNSWDSLCEIPFSGENIDSNTNTTLPDLPTKSNNRLCRFYLNAIKGHGSMPNIKSFLESILDRESKPFSSETELNQFCTTYADQLSSTISHEDKSALKKYSGFNYQTINSVARGHWDYHFLGAQTPEKLASTEQSISQISHAISSAPDIEKDLVAYRGTNLDSFQGYNINSLSDLTQLQNQFFLERGFTSTSLSPDKSFVNYKSGDNPLRRTCDISIEYLLPAHNHETIGLFSDETSYSPGQREILINKNSLSYVSSVEVDPNQTSAKLQMILVPRKVYDHDAP